ncbi:hypothetical protein Tco_1314730 [Tanacetum coccineum]
MTDTPYSISLNTSYRSVEYQYVVLSSQNTLYCLEEQIRRLDCKTQYVVLGRRFDTSYPTSGYGVSGTDTPYLLDGYDVEFQRISLTGFRSCTSRSHYRSILKQTTRKDVRFIEFDFAKVLKHVEFRRISLTGFRSCTSRSHYRSILKQTTRYDGTQKGKSINHKLRSDIEPSVTSLIPYRTHKSLQQACFMLALEGNSHMDNAMDFKSITCFHSYSIVQFGFSNRMLLELEADLIPF